jgi:antitoxin ParD1/3/4
MAKTLKRTFDLTEAEAAFIDRKVAAGEFRSPSAVVQDGLKDMMAYDAAVESWLKEQVVPAIRSLETNPKTGISPEEMREHARMLYEEMVRDAAE